jgi:hypothetical protein
VFAEVAYVALEVDCSEAQSELEGSHNAIQCPVFEIASALAQGRLRSAYLHNEQIARYLRNRQTLGLRLPWKQAITTTCPETMR